MWPYSAQNLSHCQHRCLHLGSRVSMFTHFLLSIGVQHGQGEHSLWSWPRPRLVGSNGSKPKSFWASRVFCKKGSSKICHTCPGLEASEMSEQRGKWDFFFLPWAIQASQEQASGENRKKRDGRVCQWKSWRKWGLGMQIQTGKDCIDG